MSEKMKQTLLAGNAGIARGNNEVFLALCSEDTDWHFIGEQRLKGKQAVREWMAKTYLEPPVVTVENLIAEGDFLVAKGIVTMKNDAGIPTGYAYCDVWKFKDDLIAGLNAFVIEADRDQDEVPPAA